MNFIKKIVDGKIDDSVHLQFQKFSRGEFKDRAAIKVKKVKDKFTINTGAEFANELVRVMAEKLGKSEAKVTGAIVSTLDLTDKLEFKDKKQFQGVKRYIIDTKTTGENLIELLNDFPKAFFALSFEVGEEKLKIKPKAPKSGKPKQGEEGPKADFCKLITKDKNIGSSFIFEKEDFKNAEGSHTFVIENIILPETEEKDFAKIRELAKRQGKIVRNITIDEVKTQEEYAFTA